MPVNPSRARSPTWPRRRGTLARCRAAPLRGEAAARLRDRARRPRPRSAAGGARAGAPRRPRPVRVEGADPRKRHPCRSCRNRPGLEHEDLTVLDRPLDVLRPAQALLEVVAEASQPRQHVCGHLLGAALLVAELVLLDAALG